MSFAERVLITIETKVDNAKAGIAGFRQSVAQAEGASGKLKAAASGVGSAMSSALGAITSPAGLAAAGTAVVGFAAKSVSAFQELGTSVGKFSDATGTTAEDASRLIEVFGDLGVAPDAAAAAIGKMSKTLATNEEALAKYGIAAVKAADGTTDVNATFIAAVDTISKIKDPTQQAAAAQATFGKSWQSMAEIIKGGAPALQSALAAVQDSKVFDDADVRQARELRDALDSVKDAAEGVMITFGKSLAPAITKLAPKIAEMGTKAEPIVKALGDSFVSAADGVGVLLDALGPLIGALDALGSVKLPDGSDFNFLTSGSIGTAKAIWQELNNEFFGTKAIVGEVADGFGKTATAAGELGDATGDTAEALKAGNEVLEATAKLEEAYVKSVEAAIDALAEQSQGFGDAADNQRDYNKSLDEFNTKAADGKTSAEDLGDAAIKAAKDHASLYESLTTAAGGVVTMTGKLDAQNQTLLETAQKASGPARQGILDYTFALNGIPPEKQTDIITALNRGDLDEAKRLLDEASANRTATMKADADNASLASTNRDLDNAARDRTATINVRAAASIIPGLAQLLAAGGTVNLTGTAPAPASVNATLSRASRAAQPTVVQNITNHVTVPRIPSGRELARVSERWSRLDGRR